MNILYWTPKYQYDCKMDRGRMSYVEAVKRRDDVNLTRWGDGWTKYDPTLSLANNLTKEGRDAALIDYVWTFKPTATADLKAFSTAICFNDAYAPERQEEIREIAADVVVCHHENDLDRFKDWTWASTGGRVVHIPHAACKMEFAPKDLDEDRPIDVLLTGVLSERTYPLRCRVARLIQEGKIPGEVRPHPGYRTDSADTTRRQFEDYAAHLRRAKIAICDASVYSYALAKYVEAFAAGCVVVGETPTDRNFVDAFGPSLVAINNDMSDVGICGLIERLLANPGEIEKRRLSGHAAYLAGHTTDHYAERFVEALRDAST